MRRHPNIVIVILLPAVVLPLVMMTNRDCLALELCEGPKGETIITDQGCPQGWSHLDSATTSKDESTTSRSVPSANTPSPEAAPASQQPQVIERIIEKPVVIERVIERPVIVKEVIKEQVVQPKEIVVPSEILWSVGSSPGKSEWWVSITNPFSESVTLTLSCWGRTMSGKDYSGAGTVRVGPNSTTRTVDLPGLPHVYFSTAQCRRLR